MEKADIIIPVYKPDGKFLTLIEKLGKQSVLPNRIIIMNTEQKYYDRLIYGTSFQKEHRDMVVKHLSRREFDHGRTRNRGVQYSDTDFFIMMTQDAVPADEYLVERLLEQLGGVHLTEEQLVLPAAALGEGAGGDGAVAESSLYRVGGDGLRTEAGGQGDLCRTRGIHLIFERTVLIRLAKGVVDSGPLGGRGKDHLHRTISQVHAAAVGRHLYAGNGRGPVGHGPHHAVGLAGAGGIGEQALLGDLELRICLR